MDTSPTPIVALFTRRQGALQRRIDAAHSLADMAAAIAEELTAVQDEAVRELASFAARRTVRQGIDAMCDSLSGIAEATRLEAWYEAPPLSHSTPVVSLLTLRLFQTFLGIALVVALLSSPSALALLAFVLFMLFIIVELVIVQLDPRRTLRNWLQNQAKHRLPFLVVKGL